MNTYIQYKIKNHEQTGVCHDTGKPLRSEGLWSTDHKQQMTCWFQIHYIKHYTVILNISIMDRHPKDLYRLILNRNEQWQAKRGTRPVRCVFVMHVVQDRPMKANTQTLCRSTSRCCPKSPQPLSTCSSCPCHLWLSPSHCPRCPSCLQHYSCCWTQLLGSSLQSCCWERSYYRRFPRSHA